MGKKYMQLNKRNTLALIDLKWKFQTEQIKSKLSRSCGLLAKLSSIVDGTVSLDPSLLMIFLYMKTQ